MARQSKEDETGGRSRKAGVPGSHGPGKPPFLEAGVVVLMRYRPLAELIRAMLQDEGIAALECGSLPEALAKLAPESKQIVILDPQELSWEDPDARELLRRLGGARIVAFTALSPGQLEELSLRCAAIVAKTVDLEPLVSAVKGLQPT